MDLYFNKDIHCSNLLIAVSDIFPILRILPRELLRPVRVLNCVLEVVGSNHGCFIDYPGSEFS
jgi:hypothetical protein